MTQGDEDQDRALRAFLLGDALADADGDQDAPCSPRRRNDALDDVLRNMGCSPDQRERMRRGTPRPRDEKKDRAINARRFEWHLTQRLPDRPAGEVAGLVRAWVAITNYDLELAQRWWDVGIDPAKPELLAEAIAAGFRVEDLSEVVDNRTVAEHLQRGTR